MSADSGSSPLEGDLRSLLHVTSLATALLHVAAAAAAAALQGGRFSALRCSCICVLVAHILAGRRPISAMQSYKGLPGIAGNPYSKLLWGASV